MCWLLNPQWQDLTTHPRREASIVSYALIGVLVLVVLALLTGLKIVPQKQVLIIERLGRFHSKAEAGVNLIVPFFDSARARHDLREQITNIEPQQVITKDNVTMEVDAVIYYLIGDPVRATYEVEKLAWGIEQLTLSALRNVIGSLDLDHTLTSRDAINTQLRAALDSATQPWGIKIMRVELKNITPPDEVRITMEKQMTAERSRRAVVTTAEGEKASAILRAEGIQQSAIITAQGEKESAILSAEGQAEARLRVAEAEAKALRVVADALGKDGKPAQYLIAKSYLESLMGIASDATKTVFVPYEASAALGSIGAIRELWQDAQAS